MASMASVVAVAAAIPKAMRSRARRGDPPPLAVVASASWGSLLLRKDTVVMGYRSRGQLSQFGAEGPMLEAMRRTTERVGRLLHERVTDHTPVAKPPPGVDLGEWVSARHGRLPSTLRDSWRVGEVTVLDGGRRMRIPVFTRDRIAPYVEYRTAPHIIMPRRPGGILRFWNRAGATVWATIVHHPGSPGAYMMTTALAEVAAQWQDVGREEMVRWAAEQTRMVA